MKGRKIKKLHFWTNQLLQGFFCTVHVHVQQLESYHVYSISTQVVNVCHVVPLYNLGVGSTYIHVHIHVKLYVCVHIPPCTVPVHMFERFYVPL